MWGLYLPMPVLHPVTTKVRLLAIRWDAQSSTRERVLTTIIQTSGWAGAGDASGRAAPRVLRVVARRTV